MEWNDINKILPKISYLESDNEDDPYECYPVLVYSEERPGIQCVAYLVKNQDENDWNFEELSWNLYIPGNGGSIEERDFETFSKWAPLPPSPQ